VVHRRQLRDTLSNLCRLLSKAPGLSLASAPEPPTVENLPVPANV